MHFLPFIFIVHFESHKWCEKTLNFYTIRTEVKCELNVVVKWCLVLYWKVFAKNTQNTFRNIRWTCFEFNAWIYFMPTCAILGEWNGSAIVNCEEMALPHHMCMFIRLSFCLSIPPTRIDALTLSPCNISHQSQLGNFFPSVKMTVY